jgi:O-antigen ligase
MLALALGSALNLALGQGALAALTAVLVVRAARGDAALAQAVRRLGDAFGVPAVMVGALAMSSLLTAAPWPGGFDGTRWRGLLALPVGALALSLRGPLLALRCAQVFAAGCAVHALVGLYQVWTGAAPLADLLRIPPERRVIPAPDRADLRAAGGFFYNRVRLSHVLAAGAAVSVGLAWRRGAAWVGWAAAAALTVVGLMFTYGRAALGALGITLAVAAVLLGWRQNANQRRRMLGVAGALAVGVVAALAALPAVRERMASAVDVTRNLDRLFLWGRGVEMASDHAPYGTGFGGYAVVRDAYYNRVMDTMESRAMSHNLLLSLLAETGVAGLLMWLWAWWALFRRAWVEAAPAAVLGALAAATFHAATLAHDPVYQAECALAWATCGALMGAGSAEPARVLETQVAAARPAAVGGA